MCVFGAVWYEFLPAIKYKCILVGEQPKYFFTTTRTPKCLCSPQVSQKEKRYSPYFHKGKNEPWRLGLFWYFTKISIVVARERIEYRLGHRNRSKTMMKTGIIWRNKRRQLLTFFYKAKHQAAEKQHYLNIACPNKQLLRLLQRRCTAMNTDSRKEKMPYIIPTGPSTQYSLY